MTSFYESERAVSEYLMFHYGEDQEVMPWSFGPREALRFPVRCVAECLLPDRLSSNARGLDLGCALGRSTFELAKHCSTVIGIDSSERFISVAQKLQALGTLNYAYPVEGDLLQNAIARVPAGVNAARIRFEVGNAMDLRPDLGTFDVVLGANLLDRVPEPRRLLASFEDFVSRGGQLILTSPYTWLPEYTVPSHWLCAGGRRTSDVLAEHLPAFRLERRLDMPFLIREHSRKYQWSVAEATVWVRD